MAQDGGVPHAGCLCPTCTAALEDPRRRVPVVALGIADPASQSFWLIDASPDLPMQWALMQRRYPNCSLKGIFLTHVHVGHVSGLLQLGEEAASTSGLPVFLPRGAEAAFAGQGPFGRLVRDGHIDLREIPDPQLAPGLQIRGVPVPHRSQIPVPHRSDRPVPHRSDIPVPHRSDIPVPHRSEAGTTLAYLVKGENRTLFYCPDIDSWDDWERDLGGISLTTFLSENRVSVALLDATFFSGSELPGRDAAQVPHPLVTDTLQRLTPLLAHEVGRMYSTAEAANGQPALTVRLIHLNHTNPLLLSGQADELIRAALASNESSSGASSRVSVGAVGEHWDL